MGQIIGSNTPYDRTPFKWCISCSLQKYMATYWCKIAFYMPVYEVPLRMIPCDFRRDIWSKRAVAKNI